MSFYSVDVYEHGEFLFKSVFTVPFIFVDGIRNFYLSYCIMWRRSCLRVDFLELFKTLYEINARLRQRLPYIIA